jgi:hypothetical protein
MHNHHAHAFSTCICHIHEKIFGVHILILFYIFITLFGKPLKLYKVSAYTIYYICYPLFYMKKIIRFKFFGQIV